MTRRPTIIDVAKKAGLSKATVARVINGQEDIAVKEDTRKRVLDAAKSLGYIPNQVAASMRSQRTNTVAISISDISNPFFPELVRGAQDTLGHHGYNLIMFNNDWNAEVELRHFDVMKRTLVDGVILSPSSADLDLSIFGSTPLIVLGNSSDYHDYDSVGNDSRGGVRLALDRLFELGHSRIGLVLGGSMKVTSSSRLDAYLQFLKDKNLELNERLIARCDFGIRSADSIGAAQEAVENLFKQSHPPTAIFASNDILALATLQIANAFKVRVPEEVSIVGMDDIFSASASSPPLTTVSKQRYELGALAAERLLKRMATKNRRTPSKVLLQCRLVERGTTCSIAGKSSSRERRQRAQE